MVNFYKQNDHILMEMGGQDAAGVLPGLQLVAANSVDADGEKHVPQVGYENGKVVVRIGAKPHPMTEEHYIQWVWLKTSYGGIYCTLSPGDAPEVELQIDPDSVEEVYIWCNLHGLWKAKEPVLPMDFNQNTVACSPEFTAGCVNPSGN